MTNAELTVTLVKWRYERTAKDIEAAAHGVRMIARGIRRGWQP